MGFVLKDEDQFQIFYKVFSIGKGSKNVGTIQIKWNESEGQEWKFH